MLIIFFKKYFTPNKISLDSSIQGKKNQLNFLLITLISIPFPQNRHTVSKSKLLHSQTHLTWFAEAHLLVEDRKLKRVLSSQTPFMLYWHLASKLQFQLVALMHLSVLDFVSFFGCMLWVTGRSELGLYRQQHQVIWSFPCCVIALCSEQAILFAREENCGSVIEDVYLII
jgi:hypothetical protein